MGFSGNFTRVSLGEDPAGGRALFVEGRTDASDPPEAIHVIVTHRGEALQETALAPTLEDWQVRFAEGEPPFEEGENVFVVGIAVRPAPHDPFVWEGSFQLEVRDFP